MISSTSVDCSEYPSTTIAQILYRYPRSRQYIECSFCKGAERFPLILDDLTSCFTELLDLRLGGEFLART